MTHLSLAALALAALSLLGEPTRPTLGPPHSPPQPRAVRPAVAATQPGDHPYPGVKFMFIQTAKPAEKVFAAIIDLKASRAVVRTTRGGPDPDGPGPAQTTLIRTTAIAEREHFDIAVNGDYFKPLKAGAKDAEGEKAQSVFVGGTPATVAGPAMTDGELWSTPPEARPAVLVHRDGRVSIERAATPSADVTQAIAGNVMLVENGKPLHQEHPDSYFDWPPPTRPKGGVPNYVRHPRTAVGVSQDGRTLILVVVDGRIPGTAEGMNWKELARQLADLGAHTAVNLDGGGSSTFVLRNPATDALEVQNFPSDHNERSVANALGVTFPRPSR